MKPLFGLLLLLPLAGSAQAVGLGQQVAPRAGAESVAPTTSVRSLYVAHCAGCHGMDASGSKLGQVPDMRRLGNFLRLSGGREFLVQVPGVMGSGLNDVQVAEVSNWLLATLAKDSVPASHQLYTAAEIARLRAKPLVDVAATRQGLVAQGQRLGVPID